MFGAFEKLDMDWTSFAMGAGTVVVSLLLYKFYVRLIRLVLGKRRSAVAAQRDDDEAIAPWGGGLVVLCASLLAYGVLHDASNWTWASRCYWLLLGGKIAAGLTAMVGARYFLAPAVKWFYTRLPFSLRTFAIALCSFLSGIVLMGLIHQKWDSIGGCAAMGLAWADVFLIAGGLALGVWAVIDGCHNGWKIRSAIPI